MLKRLILKKCTPIPQVGVMKYFHNTPFLQIERGCILRKFITNTMSNDTLFIGLLSPMIEQRLFKTYYQNAIVSDVGWRNESGSKNPHALLFQFEINSWLSRIDFMHLLTNKINDILFVTMTHSSLLSHPLFKASLIIGSLKRTKLTQGMLFFFLHESLLSVFSVVCMFSCLY